MQLDSPLSGAVRDIHFIDLKHFPTPLSAIVDRLSNQVDKSQFDGIDMLNLENMPNGICEYRINHERGRGFKVAISLNIPNPTGLEAMGILPYQTMILIAPYSFPKGKYYVIGDVYQPVFLEDFASKTGTKFTDLHGEELQFNTNIKTLPPIVSFL